jgi:uncharacterized membrane protein (Fun14 family)
MIDMMLFHQSTDLLSMNMHNGNAVLIGFVGWAIQRALRIVAEAAINSASVEECAGVFCLQEI